MTNPRLEVSAHHLGEVGIVNLQQALAIVGTFIAKFTEYIEKEYLYIISLLDEHTPYSKRIGTVVAGPAKIHIR